MAHEGHGPLDDTYVYSPDADVLRTALARRVQLVPAELVHVTAAHVLSRRHFLFASGRSKVVGVQPEG